MKKLCIILSVLIILGCIGYIAYDKITDYMVKKTLTMFMEDEALRADIQAAMEDIGVSGDETLSGNLDAQTQIESEAPAANDKTDATNTEKKDEKGRQPAAYPTAPPPTSAPKKSGGSLTIDDLQGEDKAYVMSIYNRFTASEVSTVSGMLSNGLTPEEKRTIKSIVYSKVSGAEIDRLYAIARKYQ